MLFEHERRHIIFSGRVQGVGFRYRAYYLAKEYNLTGWVQNLWNGTVEMEVQGPKLVIDKMIKGLGKGSFIRIDQVDSKLIPLKENEKGFRPLN